MEKVYFTITTTREVAENIERVLKSPVHSKRSICIGNIRNEQNYSVVQIIAKEDSQKIQPEDIFWLGYFTNYQEQINSRV